MSKLFYIQVAILFIVLTPLKTVAQNTLYFQGFEGSICENWNYAGGEATAGVQRTGSHSGRIGNTSNTLLFSPANVSGYSGLVLSIYHSVKPGPGPGMDTREGAIILVSIDGGPFVTLGAVGGYSDANWAFNSSSGGAASGSAGCAIYTMPNPVMLNIPNGTSTIQVKVISIKAGSCNAFNNAMNNASPGMYDRSDEGFYIDDVKITTTSALPSIKLISPVGTDSQHINSCAPSPITNIDYDAGLGAVDVTGLPPGVVYNYATGIVTISGTPITDGVYNYTVRNICTDSSAKGSITKTTPTPVIENTEITGCNAVVFNGNTYTASTIVNDTLKSIIGCDSIYKITSIIVSPITPVTQASNLNSCNIITFNGVTYTSSTVLNDTLKSYQGCDSVFYVTNIIITPVVPVIQTTNLNSCNSIIFNGTTYTSSVILKDTLKSRQGCDSIYVITNILINNILPVTQTSNLSSCSSVIVNGITYTSSTILNDTTKSYHGCDSVYNFVNINIAPIVPIIKDSTINGCNNVVFNNITYTSNAEIIDTLKSTGDCDSVYTRIHINIVPNSFVLNLSSSANNINSGMPITLSTFSGSAYTILAWQPANIFLSQTATTQNIISDTTINISVIAKSAEGCISHANLLLSVNPLQDEIYFPSAFSPNSTAGNTTFGPLGRLSLIKNYSLFIYNRWGQLVFSTADPFEKWNGTQKGQSLNSGNFVWQANYLYRGIQKRTKKGNILLVK